MFPPLTKRDALAYVLTWETEKVEIRFDGLRRKGRDEIKGEISISNLPLSENSLLHESEITLTSTNSREVLSRKLKRREPNIDWEALIDAGCIAVVRDFRKGEVTIPIGNLPGRNPARYRVYPILLEGEPNLIFGPGGSGKSKFACFIAVLVQSGMESCHLVPIQGNVLLLDFETTCEEIDEVIKMIKTGMGLDENLQIMYRRCVEPLATDAAEIKRIVIQNDISLVVVDSVGYAIGGDMESADLVLQYFTALRWLGVTTLSIDHVTHAVHGRPYGSVYKVNAARSMWEMVKTQEPKQSHMVLGLHHKKVNAGRLHESKGFRFTFSEDGSMLDVDTAIVTDYAGQVEHMTVLKRMELLLLKEGSMRAKDIAQAIDTSEETVRVTLSRNKSKFENLGDGLWGMAIND